MTDTATLTCRAEQRRAYHAKRQRVYRARRREGRRVAQIEYGPDVVAALVANGWIGTHETDDPRTIENALSDLIDVWSTDRLDEPLTRDVKLNAGN